MGRYGKELLVLVVVIAVVAVMMRKQQPEPPTPVPTVAVTPAATPDKTRDVIYTMHSQRIGRPPADVGGSTSWSVADGVVVSVEGGALLRDGVEVLPASAKISDCEKALGRRKAVGNYSYWHLSVSEDLLHDGRQLILCQQGRVQKYAKLKKHPQAEVYRPPTVYRPPPPRSEGPWRTDVGGLPWE